MNARSTWMRGSVAATLVAGLFAAGETECRGAGRGQKGHASHPPRVSAPRQSFKAPRMPHSSAPAHTNARQGQMGMTQPRADVNRSRPRNSRSVAHSGNAPSRVNNALAPSPNAAATSTKAVPLASGSGVTPSTMAAVRARSSLSGSTTPSSYTYGSGPGAYRYRAYGYGSGYRNRYYGGRYGYGRSQGNNRAIVARLRSVHANLARLDHDYQGHRVRAMHAISMAIRQLSHRSMVYNGAGFSPRMNNVMGAGMGMGMRRSVLGGAGRGGRGAGVGGPRMSQAQSDARMSQALRALQGIGMQLSHQGSNTMGQGRALGHVQTAAHELNVALSIR